MSKLQSFHDPANVVVAGASGGIGNALVSALQADARVGKVAALSRQPLHSAIPGLDNHVLDFIDETAIAAAARACAAPGPIDLVIVATGILHREPDIGPEKRIADLDANAMNEVLNVNTVIPALLAKHFLPHLRRDAKSALAAISARVGSISDNRLGGWVSYRASKAALNMVMKTFAIEQSRTHPGAAVVTLHPGTTDTQLSRPFQRNVPPHRLYTPDRTASRLLQVIGQLEPADSGRFFNWDGSEIPW